MRKGSLAFFSKGRILTKERGGSGGVGGGGGGRRKIIIARCINAVVQYTAGSWRLRDSNVRWPPAHCILSRTERKDPKSFSCCANIYWVRARFN